MTSLAVQAFAEDFEVCAAELPGPVETREAAWQSFAAAGFPTAREEDWRFASLKAIRDTAWTPARSTPPAVTDAIGLAVGSLADALESGTARGLDAIADFKTHSFVALNRALFRDGTVISVDPERSLPEPVYIVNQWGDDEQSRSVQSRNLIRIGAGSRAIVVEVLSSRGRGPTFANLVTEIELEPNARLDYLTLQRAGPQDQLVTTLQVRQAEGSRFASHSLALGSQMHRSEVRVEIAGDGGHCELNGLYLGRDQQKLDHYTTIDHVMPHTTSDELYKGILGDRSHGVFHGRIRVHPHAQKIEALQNNRNLLLSDQARVNTKPQLEIYADDVRCTHGATIGQLDPDHVFFLRTRGIPETEAVGLLTYGFASEVLERLPVREVAEDVRREILEWLGGGSKS